MGEMVTGWDVEGETSDFRLRISDFRLQISEVKGQGS